MRFVNIVFMAIASSNLAGCDRIEGKARDLAHNARQAAKDAMKSDLQRAAEALCTAQFTHGPVVAKSSSGVDEPPNVFVSGEPRYRIKVQVLGDGKYRLEVPLFRKNDPQGLYTGGLQDVVWVKSGV